jgi:purine operon repressor
MKFRRSERLIDMTNYLLEHPNQLVPLTYFADRYASAKSSISEDLGIVKETFEQRGIGLLFEQWMDCRGYPLSINIRLVITGPVWRLSCTIPLQMILPHLC